MTRKLSAAFFVRRFSWRLLLLRGFLVSLIAMWFLATVLAGSLSGNLLSNFSAKQVLRSGSTKSYIRNYFLGRVWSLIWCIGLVLIVELFSLFTIRFVLPYKTEIWLQSTTGCSSFL
jgi:hypothetical protein